MSQWLCKAPMPLMGSRTDQGTLTQQVDVKPYDSNKSVIVTAETRDKAREQCQSKILSINNSSTSPNYWYDAVNAQPVLIPPNKR